jgi:putative Mn2+ efflux pump MntP
VTLFSTLWYVVLIAQPYGSIDYYWKILVPPIMGAIVFILIGLYMMKSGAKKEKEREIQLL